jgi:outer membrane PBP1 activator LpoA protein
MSLRALLLLPLLSLGIWLSASAQETSLGFDSPESPNSTPSLEADLRQRAASQFAVGDVAGAIATHNVLESALTGSARAAARDALWQALMALPANTDFSGVTSSTSRGWVELAALARSAAPLSAYEDWRERYPNHPGESQIAAGLVQPALANASRSRQIGLLLPLTGPLAAASSVVQSGAEAAQRRAGPEAPTLWTLDTSASLPAAVATVYTHGAAAMIGPLRKEDVAALAVQPPPLPVVTLNYLDTDRSAPNGLYPFGLAPEDEARAAAIHAASSSLRRAVVIAQQGDWGERATAAFKAEFEARGGTLIGEASFKANAVDFTALLKRALGVTYSEARGKKLETAGIKAELQPVPRGDIDVVFLAARSAQAKMIWPQMRYLRAGHIATYALAAAADAGNDELGRLMVCDAPWRIEQRGSIAALRGELAVVNPRTADAQRLFALGYDAYELARRVQVNALLPGEMMDGLTGTLVLEADGAVHRRLDCVPLSAPRGDASMDEPAG